MSITYTPDPGSLVEMAAVVEATYGTYLDPTSGNGGVQVATVACPDFGLGSTPIEGEHLTGTIQKVITHAAIRGLDVPYVSFEAPLSANNISLLMHMLMGSALTSNAWALSNSPPGFSVGVHVQRSGGGGDYFKFAGCRVGAASITMPLGGMPTIRLDCIARTLAFPDTSPATFPTLTPTLTNRPFILQDSTLRHATATGSPLTTAAAVKIRGFSIGVDLGLLIEHNSTATTPDSITRTAFDTRGEVSGRFSAEWWDEWKAIIPAEASLGQILHYAQFLLNDGTNTLRLVMPCKFNLPGMSPDERAVGAPLTFIAAGDDGTPTNPVIKVENI